MKLSDRLTKLEQSTSQGNQQVVDAMRAKLSDPDLPEHKRDLIQAIIGQRGIVNFNQRHDAAELGIQPDISIHYEATHEKQ